MANIALLNYCNLSCPYCFAERYIEEEEKQSITMEQLDRILEFIGRTTVGRVGLIGGEPTIHPEFSAILEKVKIFCKEHHTRSSIFTNGIELYNYINLFDDNIGCLINLNHPDIVGDYNWNCINRSLDRLKLRSFLDRINLGINLYHTIKDYDYIFELALKYNKEQIRVSYVAPTNMFSKSNKEEYYSKAKEIFLPFVEKAKKSGIHIHLDCNHIPMCYFSEKESELLNTVVDGYHEYCEPVVDITPDFQCTACFGAYELMSLDKFNNIQEVERYLRYKKLYVLQEMNSGGRCSTCSKHENLSCQGGCLAFVNR